MELIVSGFNFRTSTIAQRERWSLSADQIPLFLEKLSQMPQVGGAVYLPTCNRVEVYAAIQKETPNSFLIDFWKKFLGHDEEIHSSYVYRHTNAFAHLLKVAAGLDSMVLGETQILGQVKQAYLQALEKKTTGALINFIFQHAFQIAKQIRSETGIAKHPTSVPSVAVMLMEQVFGDLKNLTALVVGLGSIGSLTAELLSERGVKRLLVSNRTRAQAENFAMRIPAEACPFEDLERFLPETDLVVTSTAAENPILSKAMLRKAICLKKEGPLVLIDLGLPRDIEPAAGELENVFLYNVDDLKNIADKNLAFRKEEAKVADRIIQEAGIFFEREWSRRLHVGRVAQLVRVLP